MEERREKLEIWLSSWIGIQEIGKDSRISLKTDKPEKLSKKLVAVGIFFFPPKKGKVQT